MVWPIFLIRSITTGELVEGDVCNNVFRIAEIQQDGNIYCCARYDGNGFVIPAIGNLENDKFGDIWNRGIHRKLSERLLKHNPTGYCSNCYYSRSLSTYMDKLDGHEEEILLRFRAEYGELSIPSPPQQQKGLGHNLNIFQNYHPLGLGTTWLPIRHENDEEGAYSLCFRLEKNLVPWKRKGYVCKGNTERQRTAGVSKVLFERRTEITSSLRGMWSVSSGCAG
jgi:radical SAM protein with 4Fe4S-binding SPASM domain